MHKILFFKEKILVKLASVNTVLYLVLEFEETLKKTRNPTMKQAQESTEFYYSLFPSSQVGLNVFKVFEN